MLFRSLEAQLQLLDQLRRPRLLLVPPSQPERLGELLAEQPDGSQRFDWIAARQPLRDTTPEQRQRWLDALSALALEGTRLRWLISEPCLGPAGGLLELGGVPLEPPLRALLERVRQLEDPWLRQQRQGAAELERQLRAQGWQLAASVWQERLELPLSEALLRRWFAPESPYRSLLRPALAAAEIDQVAALFAERRGGRVVQLLEHRLLAGCWSAPPPRSTAGATPGPTPRPGAPRSRARQRGGDKQP